MSYCEGQDLAPIPPKPWDLDAFRDLSPLKDQFNPLSYVIRLQPEVSHKKNEHFSEQRRQEG